MKFGLHDSKPFFEWENGKEFLENEFEKVKCMVLKRIIVFILSLMIHAMLAADTSYSGTFYADNTKVSLQPVFEIKAIHELSIRFLIKDEEGNFTIESDADNPVRLIKESDNYARGETIVEVKGLISEPVDLSIRASAAFRHIGDGKEVQWGVHYNGLVLSGIENNYGNGELGTLDTGKDQKLTSVDESFRLSLSTSGTVDAFGSDDKFEDAYLYVYVSPAGA